MIRALLIMIALAVAGVACGAGGGGRSGTAPAKVIYSAGMCDGASGGPAVTWIGSAPDLQSVYERIRHRQPGGKAQPPPAVDFATRAVLWVRMGRQPSAGYGLSLQEPGTEIGDGTLILRVKWLEPAPDRVYAQVITSPCLLVSVPRGGYHRVEVRDEHGTVRMHTDVSAP